MEGVRQPLRKNIYHLNFWRITVLTSRLFRLEYSTEQQFEDRLSQIVVNRDFDEVACTFSLDGDAVRITTADSVMWVSRDSFDFSIKSPCDGSVWSWGAPLHNLGGTARTLDNADGAIPLEDGIFSEEGIGILEDRSCLLNDSGELCPRSSDGIDLYVFLYGKRFEEGLRAFYQLSGSTPLLPRFALGNWWSRFWPYTQQEYLELMDRFDQECLPISVSVLDMDWHVTKVPEGYSGWTGYTWNRELIPDPKELLSQLHQRGKHVTLNLHPADGVQPFEEGYRRMAETMGLSPDENKTIPFDFVDDRFRAGYFNALLHPLEQEGVDFWWIDWQQGTQSKIPGLDPLWLLNHYHFLDAAKEGKQPLILSRYAGPGSHRYPIGFSGDTVVSWDSLKFQPYFTATAANIGYGWWSHDIGGHMNGIRDDELACRWVQFGVFSPINRLHSTCNRFAGKEPWKYRRDIREIMGRFLRLRHQLIPYLHTMNHRCHEEGIPLIRPMYHGWPGSEDAYRCPNQYEFGSQMIVAPVVTPGDLKQGISKTDVWLPDGTYYDFFTGIRYKGGRWVRAYRPLSSIPVFVKAGGIIPMEECDSSLLLLVYPDADGHFTLYDDLDNGECKQTEIHLLWDQLAVTIHNTSTLKIQSVCFCGMDVKEVAITVGSKEYSIKCCYDRSLRGSVAVFPEIGLGQEIRIHFPEWIARQSDIRKAELFELLQQSQMEINLKEELYSSLEQAKLCHIPDTGKDIPQSIRDAIFELLCTRENC